MKRLLYLIIVLFGTSAFTQSEEWGDSTKRVDRFNQGEQLSFELGYGWFTLGKANLSVDDELRFFQNRPCYKVDIAGRTTGLLGAFSKVNDMWGGFVDYETMLPLNAYADLQEGKYQRKEDIIYDHSEGLITIDMTKRQKKRPTKYYDFNGEIYDLISGYLKLRNLNYDKLTEGDTVSFKAFYDEIYYDFGVIYEGRETIKTDVGKLTAHRIVPVIPENKIFPGEKPIVAWISADASQLPLRVEAKMFFGSAYVELTDYKNIKFGPDFNK